jgi:hypothetical protein
VSGQEYIYVAEVRSCSTLLRHSIHGDAHGGKVRGKVPALVPMVILCSSLDTVLTEKTSIATVRDVTARLPRE